jgi:hypothetical protein
MISINEKYLHSIWKFILFKSNSIYTKCGKKVQVISPGFYNESDSGPDFSQATIIIDNIKWVGNVEIHVLSSDWVKHLHHFDAAYQTIILHVVWEDDMGKVDGLRYFPTIELKTLVLEQTLDKIKVLTESKSNLMCENFLHESTTLDWINWKEKLLLERFKIKTDAVLQIFSITKCWEETAFRILLQALGAKVNKYPFGILGNYISYKVIQKEKHINTHPEALLLGVAGMLDTNFSDSYALKLQEQYYFLSQKHRLGTMQKSWWKWLRMRPSNFPDLQIAILVQNINNWPNIVSVFEQSIHWKHMQIFFSQAANNYWDNKFTLNKIAKNEISKRFGLEQIKRIYINAIVPFVIAMYIEKGKRDKILDLLDQLSEIPPELNKVTKIFPAKFVSNNNLWDSQSLIQLNNVYCSQKKCLNCNIGIKILKPKQYDSTIT